MRVFSVIECSVFLIFVGYLVYEYSSKKVPMYVKIISYISWVISFGFVFLLPLDIYYAKHNEAMKANALTGSSSAPGAQQQEDQPQIMAIRETWNIIYWVNFFLIWIILPLLQEYEDAGEFTWKAKLKRSVWNNLLIYGIFIVLGGLFMIYLAYYGQMTFSAMMELFAALSNCFGTLLVVLLMSHGLVAIPKKYIQERTQSLNLKYYQGIAKRYQSQKVNTKLEAEKIVKLVCLMKQSYSDKHVGQYCSKILEEVPKDMLNEAKKNLILINEEQFCQELSDVSPERIIALNKTVKKTLADCKRAETKYLNLLDSAFLLEDVLENQHSINFKIRSTFWVERQGILGDFIEKLLWLYYVKINAALKLIAGVVFSVFSIIIIYGQCSMFLDLDVRLFKVFHDTDGYFNTQILILIPLLYIAFCTYYGLFQVQYSGFYCFAKGHNTDAPSLLFGSINFSRVSAPLCYNFLQMLRIQHTSCEDVLGRFDTSLFGSFASIFFPFVLILFTLFNFFDVYGIILERFNLQKLEFNGASQQADVEEGKKILYKARYQRERTFLTKQSTDLRNFNGYSSSFVKLSQRHLSSDNSVCTQKRLHDEESHLILEQEDSFNNAATTQTALSTGGAASNAQLASQESWRQEFSRQKSLHS